MHWLPVDALVSLRSWSAAAEACEVGFDGVSLDLATIQSNSRGYGQFYRATCAADVPLRIDLPPGGPGALDLAFDQAAQYEPDVLAFPVPSPDVAWLDDADAWALEAGVELILELGPQDSPAEAARLRAWAEASSSGIALSVREVDMDVVRAASAADGLPCLTRDWRFATAVRNGIAGFDGGIVLLGTAFVEAALELCHADVGQALQAERQLAWWLEGPFERIARGLDPARRDLSLLDISGCVGKTRGVPRGPDARSLSSLRNSLAEHFPLFAQ